MGIDEKFGDRLATSIGNLAPVVKIFLRPFQKNVIISLRPNSKFPKTTSKFVATTMATNPVSD